VKERYGRRTALQATEMRVTNAVTQKSPSMTSTRLQLEIINPTLRKVIFQSMAMLSKGELKFQIFIWVF
jgi:hypothetical protein